MESISLIDVSSEVDLLISSPSQGLSTNIGETSYSNSRSDKSNARANSREISEEILQVPELSASPKQKLASSNKCNLRKSLAWDNAFFTNEGVLNHEELAIVNSTFKKAEADKLPSIQEDLRKSSESSTTLDSDVWELENLEVDLFENLRASIQKSVGKFGRASSVQSSTKATTHLGRLDTSRHQSSNMAGISSQLKMKPPTACRRIVNSKQFAANTSKVSLPPMQVVTAGPKDLKPSVKPPRSASRATTVPTLPNKKVSASVTTKMETDSSKSLPGNILNQQSLVAVKKIPGDLCSTSSSGTLGKSPLKTTRKKGNTADHLSGLTPKSPLKTFRTKIESRNAIIKPPAQPKSRLRVSSCVSPQSSIDSLASESSLSASTFIKQSYSLGSPETDSLSSSSSSPSSKVAFDSEAIPSQELQKPPIGKPSIRKEIARTIPQSHSTTEETARTHISLKSFTGDNSARNIRRSSEVNNAKPSGLRLPSPKIGYFDPGKSLLQNPSKHSLNGTRKYLPNNPSLDSNTIRARKLDSGMCDQTRKDSKPSNQTNKEDDAYEKDSCLFTEAGVENGLHSPMRSTEKENLSSLDQNAVKVKSELLEQKISSPSLLDEKDLNVNLDLVSSFSSTTI